MQHTKTKRPKATRHYIENRIKQDTQRPAQLRHSLVAWLTLIGWGIALMFVLLLILRT